MLLLHLVPRCLLRVARPLPSRSSFKCAARVWHRLDLPRQEHQRRQHRASPQSLTISANQQQVPRATLKFGRLRTTTRLPMRQRRTTTQKKTRALKRVHNNNSLDGNILSETISPGQAHYTLMAKRQVLALRLLLLVSRTAAPLQPLPQLWGHTTTRRTGSTRQPWPQQPVKAWRATV